ncbi:MAG: metal-dependent hydrolase [Candidatus Hodarchaeota archaeon]
MAPTGFHGLLGLWLASKLDQKHKYARIGLAAGSVIPDLDLLGSVLIFLVTSDKELSIAFHRSVTHSLVVIIILLTIFYLANLRFEHANTTYFPFIIGLILGMVIHITLDMFYFDGVTLFWPFQSIGRRTKIVPFTYEDLSPAYNSLEAKIIGTLDGHFELIYYLVFAYLANKYQTNQELKIGYDSKKMIIRKWPQKLKLVSFFLIIEMVFFLSLAFISISWPLLDRDNFIMLLYIPLTLVYLLSGLLPFLMRETIAHLGKDSYK